MLLVVSGVAVTMIWLTWANFSVTVTNEGNLVSAGTVLLANDAASTPIYDVADRSPDDPLERCVEVTYLGSLPADVRLHVTPISHGEHVHLELTAGTSTPPSLDCDGFTPLGAPLFSGTLAELATAHGAWADAIEIPAPAEDGWTTASSRSFRFRLEQLPVDEPTQTGPHQYVWEARSR